MNYYRKHLLFCCNERKDKKLYCNRFNAKSMYRYAKDKCRKQNLLGANKICISESRCLGRCALGPVVVVYPEAIWYRWTNKADIDNIIKTHLLGGKIVSHLQIKD